jgi:2-hydroxy-6-oxonona-2,4-dienedioate hydrolase
MTSLSANISGIMVLAQRHETVYDGRTTVWHEWGRGTPLVLLHGGSGSWTHWLRNVLPLSEAGYRVIAPDIPGFGESDIAAVGGDDAPGTVAPLWAGLDQLVQDPYPLVGFSFGAMIAVMMAIARPQCVRHLVLVAPPGLGLREEGDKLLPWRHLADMRAQDLAHRHNLAVRMLHRPASIDGNAVAVHGANLALDRMRSRRIHQTDVVLRALPSLSCKVDVVFGAEDALYRSQLGSVKGLLQTSPGLNEFRIHPGAGHWVQFEDPERFNSELVQLLAQS